MFSEQTARPSGHPPVRPGIVGEILRSRGFIACVALLGAFAAGFEVLTVLGDVKFRKAPVPLKKPLDRLDHNKLRPYKVMGINLIKDDILDTLGTNDYIQWFLHDTDIRDEYRPDKYVSLFVTYYTGKPDQVPHVPEQCYLGGGFHVGDQEVIRVPIPALGPDVTIPVKVLDMSQSGLLGQKNRIVLYTFHANGRFCADRDDVRFVVGDPLATHAYFSKLEVTFGSAEINPPRQTAIEAGTRFLQVVVPVLVTDHWPDWSTVKPAGPPGDITGTHRSPGPATDRPGTDSERKRP